MQYTIPSQWSTGMMGIFILTNNGEKEINSLVVRFNKDQNTAILRMYGSAKTSNLDEMGNITTSTSPSTVFDISIPVILPKESLKFSMEFGVMDFKLGSTCFPYRADVIYGIGGDVNANVAMISSANKNNNYFIALLSLLIILSVSLLDYI